MTPKAQRTRRRGALVGAALAVLAGLGFGAVKLARPSRPSLPTAEVKRSEWVDWVQVRGEVKAQRSAVLTAPASAGDVQIVKLLASGTTANKGDVVVQFDPTTLRNTMDQKRSEWKQAEAEIEGARAQARLTEEQDRTALLKAQYDVERARLEASKQEILSRIEGEKNKLLLADAEQKLREAEQKLAADRDAAAADIESKKQKRDKALYDLRQAERNLAQMMLRAPVDGMVTLLPNWRAGGFGGQAPEFRQGDRAWPGASIAELPDPATLRLAARVDESDRGRVRVGQAVRVRVDALPDKDFTGRVGEISPLAKPDFSNWPPAKNFDLAITLDQLDPRLRPGMSATLRIAAERIPDAVLIPVEASFARDGRTVAYVVRGSKFEERAIVVARRSKDQLAVASGLSPGERVALKDPLVEQAK